MWRQNRMADEKIIDGIRIIEDGNVTHFVPVEEPGEKTQEPTAERKPGLIRRICDWWKSSWIKPYVKIRDRADPFGDNPVEGGGAPGIEAGIRIDF